MTLEHFDVVVIGAGLGGLSTAGYLAKAGKRVLVLEHHTVPGGYAHEFRRGHFRFEVALHALDGVAPGGWTYEVLTDLDVLEQVDFHRLDPFYTVQFPGRTLRAPANVFRYEEELIRQFPEEAGGIRQLIDAMTKVYWEVRRFGSDGLLDRRPPMAQMPATYPHMLDAMGQSWGDFMGRHLTDPALRAVFTTLWGYYGLPPSRLNAATFILPWVSYHLFGAYYPTGGSMAMSRAIEQTIVANGGEIRYRQTVDHIALHEGKAVAVTTDKGLRVQADVVVSNANPRDTMLRFVGEEHLPPEYAAKIQQDKPALSNLVLYLGLERDLAAEGWTDHELFVADTYDIEADYQAVLDGAFEQAGMVITNYSVSDPGCTPAGNTVLVAMTLAPWEYADQWGTGGDLTDYGNNPQYVELKTDAGEKLLSRVEQRIPGIRDAIKYMEVATPVTNVRYSLNPGGSIYGSEQSVENMYLGRLSEKTPIPNLFLAGAWTMGGGMSAALLAGQSVANRTLRRLDKGEPAGQGGSATPERAQTEAQAAAESDLPLATSSSDQPQASHADYLPAGTLTAAGSGREFDLRDLPSAVLFVCHTENSTGAVAVVSEHVRAVVPNPADLLIVSCVDLHHVPKVFRPMANQAMAKAYRRTAELLPDALDPAEHVIILADWTAGLRKAFGFDDVDDEAGVGLVARDGRILAAFRGLGGLDRALAPWCA